MVSIRLNAGALRVELTRGERLAALRRTDVVIPWGQIQAVEVVAEPIRLVHGLRAPGLGLPGRTKIGTWRSKGRKTFAVTHRAAPGLRITLQNNTFDEILLSVTDSVRLCAEIAARLVPSRADEGVSARLVAFRSAGITIAGTVLLPPADQPVRAAAVVITGSGPLDRDGSDRNSPIDVSRQLAEHLARSGVATLRFDKRGVAASGGDFLTAGLGDNIDDARAAVESLAAQPKCHGVPLVAIGHSEGAMIVAALAAEPDSIIDGAVLLAGPAKTGEQLLTWQAAKIAPTLPRPVRLIMRVLRTDPVKQQRKFLDRIAASTGDTVRMQGRRINAKWFRELLAFDPVIYLRGVTVPVLAITGDKDLQVDPDDLDIIASTVTGPVTIRRVPDLTHILRRDPAAPTLGDYRRQLKLPVDNAVLQNISGWIEGFERRSEPTVQAPER
jgi:pimeloyl-ACP methyl ester carboxylesterase